MCAHHTGTRTQYSKQTLQTESTGAPGERLAAAFQLLWLSSLPIKESGSEARSPGSRLHLWQVAAGEEGGKDLPVLGKCLRPSYLQYNAEKVSPLEC